MNTPTLYIIAGCNGAGKTTASFSVLPEMLECEVFINADEIARGLSPFNPDKAKIKAGRLMLESIRTSISKKETFAFETTLATRSFIHTIEEAKSLGFYVCLIFFWLETPDLAVKRVIQRVKEGGHHIPEAVVRRRYYNGLNNFFKLYKDECDQWLFIDNSLDRSEKLASKGRNGKEVVKNPLKFEPIKSQFNGE